MHRNHAPITADRKKAPKTKKAIYAVAVACFAIGLILGAVQFPPPKTGSQERITAMLVSALSAGRTVIPVADVLPQSWDRICVFAADDSGIKTANDQMVEHFRHKKRVDSLGNWQNYPLILVVEAGDQFQLIPFNMNRIVVQDITYYFAFDGRNVSAKNKHCIPFETAGFAVRHLEVQDELTLTTIR